MKKLLVACVLVAALLSVPPARPLAPDEPQQAIGFLLTFLLWAGFTVLGELLRPKPKFDKPQPSGLGDFTVPTAEEGRAIPILWGTCKVAGPNCVWYGDLGVVPITERVRTGLFSSSTITKGYRYYLGEQLALCLGPIDAVVDIMFDDRSIGGGAISVRDGFNTIYFSDGPPGPTWYEADIPPGTYFDNTQLAIAAQDAMNAEFAFGTFRVWYAFHMMPGQNDEVWFSVRKSGSTYSTLRKAYVAGVYPTGGVAARAIQAAMNGTHAAAADYADFPAEFSISYSESTGRFSIGISSDDPDVDGWEMWTYNWENTAWWQLGFRSGFDYFFAVDEVAVSVYQMRTGHFAFGSGTLVSQLGLGEPQMTAEELFGLPPSADGIDPLGASADDPPHAYIQIYMAPGLRAQGPSSVYYAELDDTIRVVVNAPNFFGGDDREGGVAGAIDIHLGTLTQTQDEYLRGVLGVDLPGYRGVCYAVFRHFYVGTTPYPKNPAFILRRCPNQLALTDGHENIDGDANPAAMLYELLTDNRWGARIPDSLIDADAFRAVGDVLFGEGLGLSMLVDQAAEAQDIATEILRHIDGVMFADPSTGKLVLRLARDDYDPDDLPTFTVPSVLACKITRPTWSSLRNTVKLKFVDRAANFTDRIVSAQDNAAVQTRDGVVSIEELNYRGISNFTTAQKVAARALKSLSYPLASLELTVNRLAWEMRPGSVFKLTWAPLGIVDMVCRVTRVSTGTLTDGKIRVDAVEDVFGVDWTAFTAPTGPEWTDPAAAPRDLTAQALEEAPLAVVGDEDRFVMTLAARGTGDTSEYEVWSDPTGASDYALTATVPNFTPFALLAADAAELDDELTFLPGPDCDLLASVLDADFAAGANLVMVDQEMVAFRDVVSNPDGTMTISHLARGVMDTTPKPHGTSAAMWFISAGKGYTDDTPYADDGLIAAKLLPTNTSGTMPLAVGDRLTCDVSSRVLRPYVPTHITINGDDYPETITGELTVAWDYRDRTDTWAYDDSGVTAAPETGTSTVIEVYGDGGTLKHTEVVSGTNTWTYDTADEETDNGGDVNTDLRVVVTQVQDAGDELVSRQAFDHSFTRP